MTRAKSMQKGGPTAAFLLCAGRLSNIDERLSPLRRLFVRQQHGPNVANENRSSRNMESTDRRTRRNRTGYAADRASACCATGPSRELGFEIDRALCNFSAELSNFVVVLIRKAICWTRSLFYALSKFLLEELIQSVHTSPGTIPANDATCAARRLRAAPR